MMNNILIVFFTVLLSISAHARDSKPHRIVDKFCGYNKAEQVSSGAASTSLKLNWIEKICISQLGDIEVVKLSYATNPGGTILSHALMPIVARTDDTDGRVGAAIETLFLSNGKVVFSNESAADLKSLKLTTVMNRQRTKKLSGNIGGTKIDAELKSLGTFDNQPVVCPAVACPAGMEMDENCQCRLPQEISFGNDG